jgi:hypothetical protein
MKKIPDIFVQKIHAKGEMKLLPVSFGISLLKILTFENIKIFNINAVTLN